MKTEWDFSNLFNPENSQEAFEKRESWRELAEEFKEKWEENKEYLEDPFILIQALKEYEKFHEIFSYNNEEYFYYHLMSTKNSDDSKIKAGYNNIREFSIEIQNMLSFFELNISKIPEEEQSRFLNHPDLEEFSYFLEKIFLESKHLLSKKEEEIMSLKSNGSYSLWKDMRSTLLSKEEREIEINGEKRKYNFSEIMNLTNNKNQEIRDKAAEMFNDILEKRKDISEFEFNAVLLNKKVNDKLRGFSRPDQARHLKDNIESEIVDTLIKTVSSSFNLSRDYYLLKSKLLGKEKLDYHERNVSLYESKTNINFEESKEIVSNVFSNLDSEFLEIFNRYLEKGQIDVFPKKGKKSGAFCSYCLKNHPVYVSLNYQGKLMDVTTLAHEMGHAINNEFARVQNSLYFGTSTATAEVASTFMEDFVFQELLKESSDEEKLGLLMERLNGDVSSIMRQIASYRFEREIHEEFSKKSYLSEEEIGEIFQKHMKSYMGEYVKTDKQSKNWWVYWSHLREYFYNYSYAFGLLVSKAMQRKVKENPDYIEKVKEFFSTGISNSVKETFSSIGIDVAKKEFWELGIKEIEDSLNEAKNLAKKLGKI
jgi:oligoendopeptidase F